MMTSNHPGAAVLLQTWVACGLREVVVSPGSRNAPLVIAAQAHPELQLVTALDERSAAHVALGLALKTGRPAAVISTSGTAAVNHGPALAEAFFSGIPLVSITADRPVSARGTAPGQMVHQTDLFRSHTLLSLEIDELELTAEAIVDIAHQGWRAAQRGPVHVNLPFEEPLYELSNPPASDAQIKLPLEEEEVQPMPEALQDALSCHDPKVLVHIGALPLGGADARMVESLEERFGLIVDAFAVAGTDAEGSTARWLAGWDEHDVASPQAIVTVGLPPMNKHFRARVKAWGIPHYHIGTGAAADFFDSPVAHWKTSPTAGLTELIEAVPHVNAYAQAWSVRKAQLDALTAQLQTDRWVDFEVFRWLAHHVPNGSSVHFANSTSARYAQWFGWQGNRLHANRGVAGIDGCLSTAVGDAMQAPQERTFLISGDAAWLYDANGLMVRPRPANLKIIVINNGGGNIFRWLDGPGKTGLLEAHFEAGFAQDLSGSAKQLGLAYSLAVDWDSLADGFDQWLNNAGPALLEIRTPGEASADYLKGQLARLSDAMNRMNPNNESI